VNLKNPNDWEYIFSNKYGSGGILTAMYGTGETKFEFEIDPANLDQVEISFLESHFGKPVVDAAILAAKNAEEQSERLNKNWRTKFS
jgi:hypothetical protein